MIYMTAGDLKIIIIETANLDELKKGRPLHTPDDSVLIAWTPDLAWLAAEIQKTDGDAESIGKLIDEASKRPQKGPVPPHPTIIKDFRDVPKQ